MEYEGCELQTDDSRGLRTENDSDALQIENESGLENESCGLQTYDSKRGGV